MQKILKHIRRVWESFGAYAAFTDFFSVVFERILNGRILVVILLEPTAITPSVLTSGNGYDARFLQSEELRKIARATPGIFPIDFIDVALAKGDRCFGVFDADLIISACWYAKQDTPIDNVFEISFSPDYVYAYRAFTDEKYRGKRLHGFGMASAAIAYHLEGRRGLVGYVRANNFASLRSCYRLGYRKIGIIVTSTILGKNFALFTPSCKRYGLRINTIAH